MEWNWPAPYFGRQSGWKTTRRMKTGRRVPAGEEDGECVADRRSAKAARSCRSRTWRPSAWSPATAAACRRRRPRSSRDTRVLAFEAGRKWGHRVNVISAGPVRLARGERDRLHRRDDRLREAQLAAARGDHARGGRRDRGVPVQPARERHHRHDVYVDKGYHAMGIAVDRDAARHTVRRGAHSSLNWRKRHV